MFYYGDREILSNERLVPGLTVAAGWLDAEEQRALLADIDAGAWTRGGTHRVQRVDAAGRAAPGWARALRERGIRAGLIGPATRRLVVTEYARGAGDPLCVEARAAIGLGSACVVLAENPRQKLTVPILLAPGTLLAPQRTRAAWRLSVPTRRVDVFEGRRFARGRRLVVAFGGPG